MDIINSAFGALSEFFAPTKRVYFEPQVQEFIRKAVSLDSMLLNKKLQGDTIKLLGEDNRTLNNVVVSSTVMINIHNVHKLPSGKEVYKLMTEVHDLARSALIGEDSIVNPDLRNYLRDLDIETSVIGPVAQYDRLHVNMVAKNYVVEFYPKPLKVV